MLKAIIDNSINNLQKIKDNIVEDKIYPIGVRNAFLDLGCLINALNLAFTENSFNEDNQKENDRRILMC